MNGLSEIPENWILSKLGDILTSIKGKKPKNLGEKSEMLNIPYINIKSFEKGVFKQFTDGENCRMCDSEDILMVWDGARCGLVGTGVYGAIGSTLAKLNYYEMNHVYMFYFLQSYYDFINKRPRGVGIPHVEPQLLWDIIIPIPPLNEQKRIVSKIEELFTKLDAGINEITLAKEKLKIYKQSVLKHAFEGKLTEKWRETQSELSFSNIEKTIIKKRKANKLKKFNDLPEIKTIEMPKMPKEWLKFRVWEVSEKIQYGTSEKATDDSSGIPVLRMGNIKDGELFFDNLKYMAINWENLQDFLLEEDDILFNRTNSPELVGKTAVYKKNHPRSVFASYLIRVKLNKEIYNPDFLSFYINSYYGRKYISSVVIQQVGQANVNGTKLSLMPIPVPTIDEQIEIVKEVNERFSIADEVAKNINYNLIMSQNLKQSILNKAFSGQLIPQNPNDEPAEVLLKRIMAEKKKQKPKRKTRKKSKAKSKQKRLV